MTVEELCAVAVSLPGYADLGRGATPTEIDGLERRLGVTLPDSYRTFLERCGHASWEGGQIGGIGNVINDCETATLSARSERWREQYGFKSVPINAIWVGQKGNGRCLLFCKGAPRHGEVTCLEDDYERGSEVEYWKSFEDFCEWALLGAANSVVVADSSKYEG